MWGLQSNKVARRGQADLVCKFHHEARFRKWTSKKTQEVDRRSTLAGGDIAKSRIDHDDRETSTQDIFGPDEQLCSIDDPTFHCKVWRNRHLYVLPYAVSVMLYERWSLFIVNRPTHISAKDVEGFVCVTS
ncbi:predicted protein [Lichtheimia corymbifera JMRC:FSU:9682]|uniref:Uncharacterized protein n=1 Tax=Lichtheimia corymbifera JMRC:FSU:9682 TaxID=1263082 RepID=A0A068S6D4_9FUNG|nr:predicted protein [Lichtheimia corymbifera JMRC:FSU:9682]